MPIANRPELHSRCQPLVGRPLRQNPVARWAILTVIITLLFSVSCVHAADLREVQAVTDGVLMVHFNEGHIDQGLSEKDARAYIIKLDTKAAAQPANYQISSEDDPEYKTAQHPAKVGRKAKAADTLSKFRPEKFVLDHWVYLVLPHPLKRGCTYTVTVKNLAHNAPAYTFMFNEFGLRSETIHVSQVGFTPTAPKYAFLSHWMGDLGGVNLDAFTGKPFHVVREKDQTVAYSSVVAKRKSVKTGAPLTKSAVDGTPWNGAKKKAMPKNFTEADVSECNFSALQIPGTYRVVVEGMGCSFPFKIEEDVFRDVYRIASRGLFFQRAGVAKEVAPDLVYPRDHHPDDGINKFEYDKNWRIIDHPGHGFKITPTGTLKVWGWYHDAGDWDGYPGHVIVPLTLLLLYDLAPENFADGQVNNRFKSNADGSWVEEGKNGIPDLLDEAAWLIEYYKRARAAGLAAGITTGGVPGGYAGVDSCAGGASWKDTRALKFSAEDPATTYQYAACAAWLASCLDQAADGTHPASADWIKEARSAYDWAKANTREGDENKVVRQRMLAALCLYRVTKELPFHAQFASDLNADKQFQRGEEGWAAPSWWEFAAGIYGLLPTDYPGLDAALQKAVREKVLSTADKEFVQTAVQRGYRMGFDWGRTHGLGTFSTPMLYQPAIAYKISGDKKYLDVMHTTAAYCLGGNPMNMAWMTGVGQRSVKYPFHPDSWALIDYNSMVYENEILPGYVPYGSCESVDFFGPGHHFTGDEDFSRSSAYPDVENWPLSETRFENRYSIPAGEFTIVQNNAPSLFAYGFLCGKATPSSTTRTRPGVAITFPKVGDIFRTGADIAIRVKTTPAVRRVEFYYNERYMGETTVAPFAYVWRNALQGEWLITAKAYDDQGHVSRPNDPAFDVDVKIRVEAAAPELAGEKIAILGAPVEPVKVHAVWHLASAIMPLATARQAVTWTSSDPAVAAVNSLGMVTAKSPGRATIKVSARAGGHTATCQIVVVAQPSQVER